MDPLSCLAIAGAVVQFIDFGYKIVTESRALYKDGESTVRRQAAAATHDLLDFSTKFDHALQANDQQMALTEDEKALKSLCMDCKRLADSLATKLESLNVKEAHRVWNSLGTALSNVWSKKDILKTQEELAEFRRAIDTRIAGLTRNAVAAIALQESARFNALDQETQQIIQGLSDLKDSIAEDIKAQSVVLAQLLNRQDAVIRSQTDARFVVHVYSPTTGDSKIPTKDALDACQAAKNEEARMRKRIASAVLESLRFPMITERFDDVTEAHHKTFQWIFQRPEEDLQGRKWDDFALWLERGDGLYWINGKPGSGKSTLMKLVYHHASTSDHLAIWKNGSELYTASFFFWNSGTSLQKSQEGMLRSLLHDILSKKPQLIPVLFPLQWAELYLHKLRLPDSNPGCSWSLSTLMQAFQTLLVQRIVPMKLCFFIDGLDEYSGLDSHIASLFQKAANSPHVKICVSSRPHLVFKESFENQPQLRLEDLTKSDIKSYVVDILENDERMQRRSVREPVQVKELVDEIVDSASGVFLWVKLIVIDLLRGLENHDRISQLRQRLKLLPTDLEELYEHMVFKVDSIYRVEASRFYQLVDASRERDDDWKPALPLTIFALFLAEEDNDTVFKEDFMLLTTHDIFNGICETDLRLRSRCGGLLETQFGKSNFKDIAPEMKVSYIHRTVKDYLDGTGIRHILSDRTGGLSVGSFNPNIALMRAYILQLKNLEASPNNNSTAEELMNGFITFARRAESDLCAPNSDLVEEFFRTANTWWRAANSPECDFLLTGETVTSLAIRSGLCQFLSAQLASNIVKADRSMLNIALSPAPGWDYFVSHPIVTALLKHGADPNEKPDKKSPKRVDNQSPSENALTYLAVRFPLVMGKKKEILVMRWDRIIKILLQNGAVWNAICMGPNKSVINERTGERAVIETTISAREVVQNTFASKPELLGGLVRLFDSKGAFGEPNTGNKTEELPRSATIVKQSKAEMSLQRRYVTVEHQVQNGSPDHTQGEEQPEKQARRHGRLRFRNGLEKARALFH